MLELNARPGLNIQLCNDHGLLPILNRVRKMNNIPASAAARAELGKSLSE
jgi:hypothetical protein